MSENKIKSKAISEAVSKFSMNIEEDIFACIDDLEIKRQNIDLFYLQTNEDKIKQDMREEFYNVYIQNELFYRNKISELEKTIQEKNKIIDYLREMLCRASMIIKHLIKNDLKK